MPTIQNPLSTWSTRAKIGLVFGALMLAGFGAVGWLAGRVVDAELTQRESKRLAESATRMATALDIGLFERLREVSNLAESVTAAVGDAPRVLDRADLERLQSTFPYYAWIGTTDAAGNVLASTGGVLAGRDVSARPWWAAARNEAAVGDVHDAVLLQSLLAQSDSNEPLRLLDVSAPLVRGDGSFVGVLGAHLSWTWATEVRNHVLAGVDPKDSIELFVFDAQGADMRLSSGAAAAKPMLADMAVLAGRPASAQPWSDGRTYLTAAVRRTGYRNFAGLGWTVVVRQPLALTTAPAQHLRSTIWVIGAFGAALTAALGWWSAGRLLRPLREVADAAQAVSPTALSAGGDEVRRLSRALGDLVTRLRLRESELLQLTGELEQRVAQRTAELERRNADLRGMTRMVMHDVRAPMGSIQQALQLAEAADPAQQRHWLGLVARECQHVAEVVDALMALSTVESRPLDHSDVDMNALVSASIARHRAATGYHGAVDLGELPTVRGDPVLLGQVWDNLIGNAMKFSRLAQSPRIVISAQRESGRAVFRVEDNGVGFDQAQKSRLFTAFARLHADGRYPGTGLGLSIVQRIVQRHGGEVDAHSESGRGASFLFTLPASA